MGLKPTIEQIRELNMHATYFNWGLQFVSLPAGLTGLTSADLNTRAVSIDAPTRSIQEAEIPVRGHRAYQHGILTYEPITLTLHETNDSKVTRFFEDWMDLQWAPVTGLQMPKSLNQCTLLLSLLDSEDNVRMRYTMFGCWPTRVQHGGTYDATNSDTVKIAVTMRYDYYLHV